MTLAHHKPATTESLLTLRRLHVADFRDVASASFCIFRVKLALRKRSLLDVLETLQLKSAHPAAGPTEAKRAQQVVRWAHSFLPIAPNCLLDSLACALWLKSHGLLLPLVIGVRKSGETIEAHAWLEGGDDGGENYRVLWRSQGATP